MSRRKFFISSALFDVRPVNHRGRLDVSKIKQVKATLDLRKKKTQQEKKHREKAVVVKVGGKEPPKKLPDREELLAELESVLTAEPVKEEPVKETVDPLGDFYFSEAADFKQPIRPIQPAQPVKRIHKKERTPRSFLWFILSGLLISLIIPSLAWLSQGILVKEGVMNNSWSAYQNLLSAQESLGQFDWQKASQSFGLARADFLQAEGEIQQLGQLTLSILQNLPGGSLVSSGSHLVKVGENLSQAGQNLASTINVFSYNHLFGLLESESSETINSSLTEIMSTGQANLIQALKQIKTANQELSQVEIDSLPQAIQPSIVSLSDKLPLVEELLAEASNYSEALISLLGHDNPRQYLLLFQNNSEMRATGGFIGTYGLLTLDQGEIDQLLIDGVFNADGQLHEKIIPPRPIQKISTAWSMHDANWFADFPTSAEKISWFYEKTGGPTVDGVISFTPTVVERLLKLTGPIAMPDYQLTLNSENFVELIQYKVEIDYDPELNRPKKILADFTPLFIDKLTQLTAAEKKEALSIIFNCLNQKHILAYCRDDNLKDWLLEEGWSGQLLETDKDYLSVVSSNINGYKTDRLVEETIEHQTDIQPDGSIIDTLTIRRRHQGGETDYDWWNQVNANYLRVYLPQGSQLISATGQTREIYQPPLDYQTNNFQADPLVARIEAGMTIDPESGTRIFEENGKTVFGNWLYVSPGRTVTLTYQYKLPFKIDPNRSNDSYSLLIQKQSGSLGSQFSHQLTFPEDWQIVWQYPEENFCRLSTDKFFGLTFEF